MPVALTSSVHAATYYVRTDGANTNNGLTNATGGAWKTISYAATHVAAGDVVRVQSGTYTETASPSANGVSGNPITFVADGVVTTCGMRFSGRSYIRVIGFSFNPTTAGCSTSADIVSMFGTNTGLEFWNDDVGSTQGKAYIADFVGNGALCNACIVFGGSVHDIGNPGTEVSLSLAGNDVFVSYVNFANICYIGNGPNGNRNRFLNDNYSGFAECSGSHPDFFYIHGLSSLGYGNSLIESNFGSGTTTAPDNKGFHAENQQATPWNDDVWRFNVMHDLGSGYYSMYTDGTSGASNRWRFYNNSILNCARASSNNIYVNGCGGWAFAGSAYIYNTLFYHAWSDASLGTSLLPWGGFGSGNTGTITTDYNLAYEPSGSQSFLSPWTSQAHKQSNVNPQLTNVATNDYTLQSNSGARGVGGPLTTASGSGSGTSLTVAANTGSFFIGDNSANLPQYGGQLVPGDFITVGVTPVQVASVSGDVITLVSPISWNNGDPVYFGTSATQDIGAYPYKAGGYTLTASYSQSGGVATVVPSDSSLVRFVICYQNGIPTTVDNAAPYTCPMGSGAFQAIVYPRYASQTLQVVATPNGIPISSCDLNSDGVTNVTDVQLCVNQAIGATACTTGDINHDGSCNVIDVQRDVNAALGGTCVTQ